MIDDVHTEYIQLNRGTSPSRVKPDSSTPPRPCLRGQVPLILLLPHDSKERYELISWPQCSPLRILRHDFDPDSTPTLTMTGTSVQAQDPDRPPAAVLREVRAPDNRGDDREALELQEIQTHEDNELDYSTPSASSGEEPQLSRQTTRRSVRRPRVHRKGWWNKIARFWTHQVTLTVPQKSNRDHLGEIGFLPTVCGVHIDRRRSSARKNIPRLHPHLRHDRHARSPDSAALPTPETTILCGPFEVL